MAWLNRVFALFMTLGFGASVYAMEESSNGLNDEILDESVIRLIFMGKTGVGKSTAVNACFNFANQKKWNDYPKLFPIPTEFQDCNVERYRERAVENHRRGQLEAVTQEPSEYLAQGSGFKVGLIDCPGTGDPRGIGQDSINTNATAEFLAKMHYCNAFCVVMKSTVNRGTAEEVYCVEQIKTLLPLNARDRIFIIITHDTGAHGNIETFVQEVGLPADNIFYFDNFALTKDGHIDFTNIDLQAIHGHDDIGDPFSEPEIPGNDGRAIAIRTKTSWTKSHKEFNRMIRRAKELGAFCELYRFITIGYLKNSIATSVIRGVDIEKSLEECEARLEMAKRELASAVTASERAQEAHLVLAKESFEADLAACNCERRWEWAAAESFRSQFRRLQEPKERGLLEHLQAYWTKEGKNRIVQDYTRELSELRYEMDSLIDCIYFDLVDLRRETMCPSKSKVCEYYDVCIRREQNPEKREWLNRERAVYLELVTKYREIKGQ